MKTENQHGEKIVFRGYGMDSKLGLQEYNKLILWNNIYEKYMYDNLANF